MVTRIDGFNFCEKHSPFYKDIIYGLMLKNGALEEGKFGTSAEYVKGLGCWITLIDVLGGHSPMNFQMPYEPFANVYCAFVGLGVNIRRMGIFEFSGAGEGIGAASSMRRRIVKKFFDKAENFPPFIFGFQDLLI